MVGRREIEGRRRKSPGCSVLWDENGEKTMKGRESAGLKRGEGKAASEKKEKGGWPEERRREIEGKMREKERGW